MDQTTSLENSLDIINRLVKFNTVSSNSNLELIEYVEKYLRTFGISSRITYDRQQRKANLFATIGPNGNGGIVLSGHTDTVPVTGQTWASDPFTATLKDGKVYGRGTADMKGFIGTCLSLVPEMVDSARTKPIHLALTFDEETSMLGVRTLIADLRDCGIQPLACLIGEPTEMKSIVGHKGRRAIRCCVRGRSAHTSVPMQGVNAIEYASKLIEHLRSMAERHKAHEERHYGYEVPYSTIMTTHINGGLSSNTVPEDCSFAFEFRHLPWTDADKLEAEVRSFAESELLEEMRKESPECEITFVTESTLPAFGTEMGAEGLDPGASTLLEMLGRRDMPIGYMGFGTEASWFQDAGIPTVVCGPGSIQQAHKPDEYIELAQLALCEKLLRQLLKSAH